MEKFLIDSWGNCPAYNVQIFLQISRVCPLAAEIYEFLDEISPLPIGFNCKSHRERKCPLEKEMISAALKKN